MPGTILKQLVAVTQTNGTAQTSGNSGWTTITPGSGNTAVFADADKMGAIAGYRLTQAGVNTNIEYLDLDAPVTIWARRTPFKFGALPSVSCTIGRFYPTSAHSTNLGSLSITSTGRLQFTEGGTGGLNISSTSGVGYVLVPGTQYVLQELINCTTNTVTFKVYPLGSNVVFITLTGTVVADMAAATGIQSFRHSIGTASSWVGSYYSTNSDFAIGSGDWLIRTDAVNSKPIANAGSDQIVLPGQTFTLDGSASTDLDGTIASYTWGQTLGGAITLSGSGATRTGIAPYSIIEQQYEFSLSVTDDVGDSSVESDTTLVIVPGHQHWYLDSGGVWKPRLIRYL